MEVSNHLKKFKLLLEYVFEGKVVLNENTTEKLLKFLEDPNDNSPGRLLETPSFSDLIFDSLEKITNATTSVRLFIVEVTSLLFQNELQFLKMQNSHVAQGNQGSSIKYCILHNLSANIQSRPLHLACIKLATVHLTHCSGVKLLLENKVWQYILYPSIYQVSIPIEKAAYKFVSLLVIQLNKYEQEQSLTQVLEYVVQPILSSDYNTVELIDLDTEKVLIDKVIAHLNALLQILIDLEDVEVNLAVQILKNHFLLERPLYCMMKVTRSSNLISLINDIVFRFRYATIRNLLFSGRVDEFCNEIVAFYCNSILRSISKWDTPSVIDFSRKSIIFWSNFEKTHKNRLSFPLTFERNGMKLYLSDQMMMFLVEPLLIYSFSNKHSRSQAERDEFINKFQTQIGKTLTEHLFTACYSFRPLLESGNLAETAIETIRVLLSLKGHLNAAQAGLYFQGLFHVLDIFILSDGAGGLLLEENPIKSPNDVRMLSLVLESLRMLLKEHNISWYENVEIVSLQEGLMNLLKQNILGTKQLVQVLDLIDLCVNKFLCPNMTLLLEIRQESTLTVIGEVMKTYMHHEDWEVRDSALNLLLSCTDIAFIKYIPLQKVISENNLMIFAAKAALTDPQYYSQSTGLKCLAAATKIDSIWREVLVDNPHIYLQLVYILRHHPEGMVRKEAAKVLTKVYVNQKISPSFQTTLYEVMMAAALDDLHWEVQLAALRFWRHAICSQLTYRGMIDGKFPSVTFSKAKRKIITLNDEEILRQLTSIMNDLSSIGCLTVLYECMNEINNIEIIEQAHTMATELIDILDKYKFKKISDLSITYPQDSKPKDNEQDMAMDLTITDSTDIRDKVIDSILNTNQSELIMNMHDNYIQTKSDEMEEDFKLFTSPKEKIHPNKFLEVFKGTDYRSLINDKRKWNSEVYGLDVLLDEILDI